MKNGIKKLEELMEYLERDYEEALQKDNEIHIAYLDGVIFGIKEAIEEIKKE